MKEPIELFTKEGKSTQIWACGECRIVHREEEAARQCCRPRRCDACGVEVEPRTFLQCEACRNAQQEAWQQQRWDKAEKVPLKSYDGPIYDDDHDRFFHDSDDLQEAIEDGEYQPGRLYACKTFGLHFDAHDLLEHAVQDHHEDAFDQVSHESLTKLQGMLDEWAREQPVESWAPNYAQGLRWEESVP